MEQEKLEKYLQKVEEFVFDEEKIVTYKYLSRALDVHVNVAKQLLYEFSTRQQKLNASNISVTYLLAGLQKNGDYVVSIVNEDDINEAYIEFDKITSKHVYSILKGKEAGLKKIRDMLYIVDSQVEHLERYPIYYDPGIIEEIPEVKIVKPEVKPEPEEDIRETIKQKKPVTKNARHSVLSFFQNGSQPKKAKKEEESERIENKEGDAGKIAEVDLSSLKIDEEKEKKEKFSKKYGKKRKRIISNSESSENDEEEVDAMLCDENVHAGDVNVGNGGVGKGDVEDVEDEKDEKDEKDEVGLTQTKKKRKILVDKKITGEDGFIETVKEVVCETDSEGEAEQREKKEQKEKEERVFKSEMKKNPPPSVPKPDVGKGKNRNLKNKGKSQQTLFSFFKKN